MKGLRVRVRVRVRVRIRVAITFSQHNHDPNSDPKQSPKQLEIHANSIEKKLKKSWTSYCTTGFFYCLVTPTGTTGYYKDPCSTRILRIKKYKFVFFGLVLPKL
jgi:hypothetical protein